MPGHKFAIMLLMAAFACGQDYEHPQRTYAETRNYTHTPEAQYANAIAANTQAATGINGIYSLIVALAGIAGLIGKEIKDNKKGKMHSSDIQRFDDRIKKLFDYHDKMVEHFGNMGKDIVTLQHSNKVLESLLIEVKDLTKSMSQMQKDISEVSIMQRMCMKQQGGNA